ncbi:MAG: MFS transporter [Acidimicrobiia bacterium]|nr:MFS transporter [Acidimicrobiia bacterium]
MFFRSDRRPDAVPSSSPTSWAAFSSLRIPSYRTLWWGGLFTFMSVQMQFLLRGLLAWDLTEREGALGLVYLCFGLSLLFATPLGGVASDRYSKRMILVLAQFVITVFAVLMGMAVLLDVAQLWMLMVAAVAQGTAFGFFGPARVAFSADLVGREQLGNAIALSLLSMNGTRIFAPSLAGVLAGWALFGIGGAYLMAGATAVVAMMVLLRLPNVSGSRDDVDAPSFNPWAEIIDGVRYVVAKPPLRRLVLSSFFIVMFGFNYVAFYPAMIEGVFGLDDAYVGYISSASALGAVAVSIPLASRANSSKAKIAMILGGLGFGLGVIAFGLAPGFWSAFAVIGFVGGANTIYQTLSNTMALSLSDDAHQGRVQSLMQLSFAGFGIAAAPLGLLAEVIGLRQAIMGMGLVTMTAAVVYLVAEGGVVSVRDEAEALEAIEELAAA